MKKQIKKLALQLDTIRNLTDRGLRDVAGGNPSQLCRTVFTRASNATSCPSVNCP